MTATGTQIAEPTLSVWRWTIAALLTMPAMEGPDEAERAAGTARQWWGD